MRPRSFLLPWIYVALVVGLHAVVLLAPASFPVLRGAAHATAFFLMSFVLALLAMFWPGLRIRHLLYILLALLIVEPFELLLLPEFFPELASYLLMNAGEHGFVDMARSVGLQVFVSFVVAMGLWMRAHYDRFELRRGGSDREEREIIFDIKQRVLPEDNLTFYRYVRLMECGITLIGERMLRRRVVIHAFQRDNMLFLYDLMNVPGEPESRAQLLDFALTRPEFQQATAGRVYLVSQDAPGTLELLQDRGFRPVGAAELDLNLEIRRRLATVLADEFKEWQPFSAVRAYYIQDSAKRD